MDTELKTWERKYFTKPLDSSFLFYCVFGDFSADFKIPAMKYRTSGIPDGCDLRVLNTKKDSEYIQSLLEGYLWESSKKGDPDLANQISHSKECIVVKGEFKDTSDLNYLRDVIGIITYLFDNGGVGIYDPQGFRFMGKKAWTENIFSPDGSVPRNHVMILYSEEHGKKWYHTRGLRKFGRPDLSIHEVTPQYEDAIYDLFNRFIEYEAFGGIIADKQEIKMNTLPSGMWCENKGDPDDPDFNNKHVEIHWK
ncbi:MAG: hypothetical protein QM764_19925 [Chitinophagaceae bacterium]